MKLPRVLLIDDSQSFLEVFKTLPGAKEFEVVAFTSAKKALKFINKESVDVIITDVQMPDMNGLDLLTAVQDSHPHIPVIIITAFGSVEKAIQAVRQGAFHYFEKPFHDNLELFWTTVREALAKNLMLREITQLRKERFLRGGVHTPIVGRSDQIRAVLAAIRDVASLPITVLITGETGTGKELVARAIHELGTRRESPFFAVSCMDLATGLLESELFGHEKGAFTGAVQKKLGLFELADGGTLFLDEISEAPSVFQSKLLRVLETKTFMRVGGESAIESNFRVITATSKSLEDEVEVGRFRQDLLFRLDVYKIHIPPLRERKEDIIPIVEHYTQQFARAYRREVTGISESALQALYKYTWPGNVRELVNVIERAVITSEGHLITTGDLPFDSAESEHLPHLYLKEMEKLYIDLALRRAGFNKTRAAELLGITRKTLMDKIRRYGLS